MRCPSTLLHVGLALAVLGAAATAVPAAAAPPGIAAALASHHPLIVVTFANTPSQFLGRAGSTAHRYAGTGYSVSQNAHAVAERLASTYALHEVDSWPIRALSVHCVVYEIQDKRSAADVITALSKDPRVSLAQPLNLFHTLTVPEDSQFDSERGRSDGSSPPEGNPAVPGETAPANRTTPTGAPAVSSSAPGLHYNDPLYDLQTNLASLAVAQAHERSQGAGVRVGLVDTGVDTAHPDLRGRIASTRSFLGRHAASADSYRHGTAMAGLIAAVANNHVGIVGIAPLARIEVFEACWQLRPQADEAACNTFTLAQAIAAALDARVQIVNLSIAGPADPLLSALIEAGLRRGVIFVGASAPGADAFPTAIPGVIDVGSTEHVSGKPTVTAPGVHVLTLHPGAQYDFESGTSVAAAEVSGVVALLLSADPHLTIDAVEDLLKRTAGAQALPAGQARVPGSGARPGHPVDPSGLDADAGYVGDAGPDRPDASPAHSVNANVALGGLQRKRARRIAANLER